MNDNKRATMQMFTTLRSACLPMLLIALAGCQSSESSPPASPVASSPQTLPTAASQCPAPTFDGFLQSFVDDVSIQKRYIADQIGSDTIDSNAEPEPAPVKKMLAKANVAFPVMPSTTSQKQDGLTQKTTPEGNGGFAVELAKPDTDYQMTFHFRSADSCWQLYRTEDDSL